MTVATTPADAPVSKLKFAHKLLLGASGLALGLCGIWLLGGLPRGSVRLGMLVAAMSVLAVAWLAERRGLRALGSVLTALLLAMTVCTAYLVNESKLKALVFEQRIQAWNSFHYMLGTKYFDELGYFDLYYAALLADAELEEPLFTEKNVPVVRDMHSYKKLPWGRSFADAKYSGVRRRFSDARWQSFKSDLRALQPHQSAAKWGSTLHDLGFNPSPAWLIVQRPLLNWVDISDRSTLQALCSLELILYAPVFLIAWWAFGLRKTLLGTLWFNLYFGNSGNIVGSYFHYDWLCLSVAAAALYYRGHRLAAAPVLAYAAMMRGFPGLLALHPAVCWLKDALRLRLPAHRHTAFLTVLVLSCLAIVGLGSTTSHGLGAWTEWQEKISTHSQNHPVSSAKRIGLVRLFTHTYDERGIDWRMSHSKLIAAQQDNRVYFRIAQAVLLALMLLAMLRRNDHDGLLLGLAAIFAALCLSRYYASIWVLLFTWTALDRRRIGNLVSAMFLFALLTVRYALGKLAPDIFDWVLYYIINALMLFYFLAATLNFVARDYRAWRRSARAAPQPT